MVDLNAFYAALEEKFRGSNDTIKDRCRVYVPFVTAAGGGGTLGPVLDLGSGRGEWLDLLKEHGIAAAGVEQNSQFVDACRRRGLDVEVGDILTVLENKATARYGAVTAFHVIEHLLLAQQLELLAAVYRVLKPGGMLILEWPNIENVRVATYSFWLDPTHVRPLPVQLMRFMVEFTGFVDVTVKRYRESEIEDFSSARGLAAVIRRLARIDAAMGAVGNMLATGADVALIARKAA